MKDLKNLKKKENESLQILNLSSLMIVIWDMVWRHCGMFYSSYFDDSKLVMLDIWKVLFLEEKQFVMRLMLC
jgi:hypothetical protein